MSSTWLEDFIAQLGYYIRDEVSICVGKEWDRGNKGSAVVIDDVLEKIS